MTLFAESMLFRKIVNYAWKNLLSLNNYECVTYFPTFLLFLLMGFRKSSTLGRNDSINDCTFKSFKKFNKKK